MNKKKPEEIPPKKGDYFLALEEGVTWKQKQKIF
jgi:hypothetical protein